MSDSVFVDTNVLVYSRDASEPQRQEQAMAWMTHLWKHRSGHLSFQVLQEFYVTVTTKLDPGLDRATARRDVRSLLSWQPSLVDAKVIEGGWQLQDRCKIPWWDALIVSAAQAAGCRYLLTEDMQENQRFGNVTVINPFHITPESIHT